jgi:hypothetical protein
MAAHAPTNTRMAPNTVCRTCEDGSVHTRQCKQVGQSILHIVKAHGMMVEGEWGGMIGWKAEHGSARAHKPQDGATHSLQQL